MLLKTSYKENMDILIIGNGFDLAHGLPTKYTDFLKFIGVIQQVIAIKNKNGLDNIDWRNINQQIKELICNNTCNVRNNLFSEDNISMWKKLLDNNVWVDYFLHYNIYGKEDWIDFESEISKVIQSLDGDMLIKDGAKYELSDKVTEISNGFLKKIFNVQITDPVEKRKNGILTFRKIRDKLYDDLNKLVRALEIYLAEYVEKIECDLISPDIEGRVKKIYTDGSGKKSVQYSNVLSFNYTNTYKRIYLKGMDSIKTIDYIHGKANISNTIESNNMVLGIDEYLMGDRKNNEVDFIAFKKFYQRIYKQTGCLYKEWIDKIQGQYDEYIRIKLKNMRISFDAQNQLNRLETAAIKDKNLVKHNLYIFGHSLNFTDKDILKDFILHNNVYTIIFYLNKDIMGQQIANLAKIIGPDELVRRTGGSTKTIEFRKQQKMIQRIKEERSLTCKIN